MEWGGGGGALSRPLSTGGAKYPRIRVHDNIMVCQISHDTTPTNYFCQNRLNVSLVSVLDRSSLC